jgi:hypothetical protein
VYSIEKLGIPYEKGKRWASKSGCSREKFYLIIVPSATVILQSTLLAVLLRSGKFPRQLEIGFLKGDELKLMFPKDTLLARQVLDRLPLPTPRQNVLEPNSL